MKEQRFVEIESIEPIEMGLYLKTYYHFTDSDGNRESESLVEYIHYDCDECDDDGNLDMDKAWDRVISFFSEEKECYKQVVI